ncbi:MAG: carbon-nitrogen hydrolase family protein [Mycetocola sp.]
MTASTPFLVSAVQFAPGTSSEENARTVTRFISQEAALGSKLVVFPEYSSVFDGGPSASTVMNAEDLDGPFMRAVSDAAARAQVGVVLGLVERVPSEPHRFINTVVFLTSTGEIGGLYRKVHLYDAFGSEESRFVVPGPVVAPQIVTVEGLNIGMQTCYDLRFPESSRVLLDAGAEVIVVPAQWVPGPLKEAHWRTLVTARAIENSVYVVAADHPAPSGVGASGIVGPDGVARAWSGAESTVARAWIDPADVARVRSLNPAVNRRRYRVIADR